MKSADYLYDILKESPIEGYIIEGRRYGICTTKKEGKWVIAIARFMWSQLRVVTKFYPEGDREALWEDFLKANYPRVYQRWVKHEAAEGLAK